MSGIATAIIGSAVIAGGVSYLSGKESASGAEDAARTSSDASIAAAQIEAQSQRESLDYLKEREALPRQYSEQGLKGLGAVSEQGLWGIEGVDPVNQKELIDKALSSPLYGSLMSGGKAGEEAILRNASATGLLRSGNVQENLYDYNTRLQNNALLESYNQQLGQFQWQQGQEYNQRVGDYDRRVQGLSGLAGVPSYASQIAQTTAGIGQTLGSGMSASGQALSQGQVASGQAMQQGYQGVGNSAIAGAGMAVSYYSDRRLKNNIKKVSEVDGHNWYVWDWNIVAQKMGLEGKSEGVLADEIVITDPDCIGIRDGFLTVNYNKLGIFKEVAHG